jgi:hypothetical protein
MTSQVPVNHQQSSTEKLSETEFRCLFFKFCLDNDTLTSSANLPMLPSSPIQQEESSNKTLFLELFDWKLILRSGRCFNFYYNSFSRNTSDYFRTYLENFQNNRWDFKPRRTICQCFQYKF